jgi:hypothetical protein
MNKKQVYKKYLAGPKHVKALKVEAPTPPVKTVEKKAQASKPIQNLKVETHTEKIVKTKIKKQKLFDLPEDNERYFIYLKNPMEYRRQLLESSRKILYCLKSSQKLIIIRQKKLEEMGTLKNCIKELLFLSKKFNELLPKYDTGFLEKVPVEGKHAPSQPKSLVSEQSVGMNYDKTELDKLEESLASIEKKLNSLQ